MTLFRSAKENPSALYLVFFKIQNMESISFKTNNQLIKVVMMRGDCCVNVCSIRV